VIDHLAEDVQAEGLGDVIVHPSREAPVAVAGHRACRNGDDRDVPALFWIRVLADSAPGRVSSARAFLLFTGQKLPPGT